MHIEISGQAFCPITLIIIRHIRLTPLIFFVASFAKSGRNKKISMGPILFLQYEESLISSNVISKLFRFHTAHDIPTYLCSLYKLE